VTVNPAAFYIAAAIVVAAAAAAVLLPRLRHAGAAACAMSLAVAALFALSGAYAMAVADVVITAAMAAVFGAVLLRREPYCRIAPSTPPASRNRLVAAGAALAFTALLVVPFAIAGDRWHAGSGTARLVTLLHYRAPYALVIALILIVAAGTSAALIGRTSADERALDQAAEARRRRDDRVQRRREDREAARRARRGSATEAAE